MVLVGLGLRHRKGVLVDRRRRIERLDAFRAQTGIQLLDVGLGFGSRFERDALPLVDEVQIGSRVPGVEVDLPAFQSWLDDLAVAELVAIVNGVALVLEGVAVNVGQDDALGKVERRDGDGPLRRRAGWPTCRAARRRDQSQGNHRGAQNVGPLQTHCLSTSVCDWVEGYAVANVVAFFESRSAVVRETRRPCGGTICWTPASENSTMSERRATR